MIFGFLPCVITGFLLTAIPNWTNRPPLRGLPLLTLFLLWIAGRLSVLSTGISLTLVAWLDASFLVILAGFVLKEVLASRLWDRLPITILITLYAVAHIFFYVSLEHDRDTTLALRMALSVLMVLLALIGGRITPGFTEDFLQEAGINQRPHPFSLFDGFSILSILLAATAWTLSPGYPWTGWLLIIAGALNIARLLRWYGWMTWKEPLVFMLHIGYAWLGIGLALLGGSIVGIGLPPEDAIHALTTGAVGSMTLAVMTRATLGHTGRPKHAGPATVFIYLFVNAGAILRLCDPIVVQPFPLFLILSGLLWSGAYLLFAAIYGRFLFLPSLDDDE